MRQDREYLKDFNAPVARLKQTSRTIRCPRSNKNLHSLRRRFHFDTQQAWEINECEPDLRAAFAHIRQFQFDLYQTLLSESACLFVECGVLLATPIAGIRNPEIAHSQPQTGEPLRNVVSINHCHDHTPRLLRAQCNERLRQWLSLPLGIRTCFASFANPWRSSRLSSSLPQSSQRTAAKNAKPNHAPSETESLLKCGSIPYQLRTDNQIRSMPSRFGKRFYILTSEKLSGLGNSAAFYSVLVE